MHSKTVFAETDLRNDKIVEFCGLLVIAAASPVAERLEIRDVIQSTFGKGLDMVRNKASFECPQFRLSFSAGDTTKTKLAFQCLPFCRRP